MTDETNIALREQASEFDQERDQLRADLAAEQRNANHLEAQLFAAKRTIDTLGDDAAKLARRLGEAERLLRGHLSLGCFSACVPGQCVHSNTRAWLSSGSSMGEALIDLGADVHAGREVPMGAATQLATSAPNSFGEPAAPEPTWTAEEELVDDRDKHADCLDELAKKYEAMDKRVTALDSIVRKLDADVALLMPQHSGLEPFEKAADFEQTPAEATKELKDDGVNVPAFLDRVLRNVGGGGSGIGAPLSDLTPPAPPQPAPVGCEFSAVCGDGRYICEQHAEQKKNYLVTDHEFVGRKNMRCEKSGCGQWELDHDPVPVERHAFVVCNCEFCKGERCAKEPPDGGPACGQPRSAAVHGSES